MRQVHTFDRASQSQKLSRKICLPLHVLPFATNKIVCGVINADTALVKVPSSHFARAKPVRSCLVFGNANRFCGTNILQRERRYCRQNCNGSRQLQATKITPPLPPLRSPSSRRSGVSRMQKYWSHLLRAWTYQTVSSFETGVTLNIHLYTLRLLGILPHRLRQSGSFNLFSPPNTLNDELMCIMNNESHLLFGTFCSSVISLKSQNFEIVDEL